MNCNCNGCRLQRKRLVLHSKIKHAERHARAARKRNDVALHWCYNRAANQLIVKMKQTSV